MQYFSNFPLISYKFDVGGVQKYITVKDIALNVRVRKYVLSNIQLYDEYDIEDGETLIRFLIHYMVNQIIIG